MSESVSPYRLEQAMSVLMQRKQALLAADADLADDENELMGLLEAQEESSEALEVLHRLVRACIAMGSRQEAAEKAAMLLAGRAARYERREAKLRALILETMQAIGAPRLVQHDFTVSRRPQKPKVVITDEKSLPVQYVRLTTTSAPDKIAIRADLEQGVVVPGAVLGNPYEVIAIKLT